LARRAAALTAGSWWVAGPVPLLAARRDAEASSARQSSGAIEIRLAGPQCTPATLAHELAHVLAGIGHGHDARFRRAHVDVVSSLLGDEPGEWLADAYARFALPLGDRGWGQPPSHAIAL
jgi:hypothetical protein